MDFVVNKPTTDDLAASFHTPLFFESGFVAL